MGLQLHIQDHYQLLCGALLPTVASHKRLRAKLSTQSAWGVIQHALCLLSEYACTQVRQPVGVSQKSVQQHRQDAAREPHDHNLCLPWELR